MHRRAMVSGLTRLQYRREANFEGAQLAFANAGEAPKLLRRRRRNLARTHLFLHLAPAAADLLAPLEGGEQPLLEDLPHPRHGLLGAARNKPARLLKRGVPFLDLSPQCIEPGVVSCRDG